MLITRSEVIHLFLLLCAGLIQYFLITNGIFNGKQSVRIVQSAYENVQEYYRYLKEYLTLSTQFNEDIPEKDLIDEVQIDVSKIRSVRPDNLLYRVGDVVVHLDHEYIGVIIGWTVDEEEIGDEPIYEVLINEYYSPKVIRVNQSSLFALDFIQVMLIDADKYFTSFDGSRYEPKAWLRAYYPND